LSYKAEDDVNGDNETAEAKKFEKRLWVLILIKCVWPSPGDLVSGNGSLAAAASPVCSKVVH
jgi:hypothetical protein